MKITTNLRKMKTALGGPNLNEAKYTLPLFDVLNYNGAYDFNSLIGTNLTIEYEQAIHCVETGKRIKKSFGEGLSYEAFLKSPMAVESIIRPELSRIHEGVALRDMQWEEEHHNRPHFVYLSLTSNVKVGVTRTQNIPSRWIDQGATEALIIAETPYRQLAGLIEVALKAHVGDKTSWQQMLKNSAKSEVSLVTKKEELLTMLPSDYEPFFYDDDTIIRIKYPVIKYPEKVKTLKLDTTALFTGKLTGIKAQYLIFEEGHVFNMRSHSGYRVTFHISD